MWAGGRESEADVPTRMTPGQRGPVRNRGARAWALAAMAAVTVGALTAGLTIPTRASAGGRTATPAHPGAAWTGSWSAAPSGASGTFSDETLREIVRTTLGGDAVRIRLTNALSTAPLAIDDATVALRTESASVSSVKPVTFDGLRGAVVPPGAEMLSDPVALSVHGGQDLAVSIYVQADLRDVSQHNFANTTSYLASGDHTADPDATAFTQTITSWPMLDGLDVRTSCREGAVVALGDSITDGVHSDLDASESWPADLARRLAARGTCHQAVLNEGIDGNRILSGNVPAEARFDRDVLAQTGVRTVIFLEGINDIGHDLNAMGGPLTAREFIDGMQAMIRAAHEKGLRVIGGTLLPIGGSKYDTPAAEATLAAVDGWIRAGGAFDSVIDFASAVRDPSDPSRLRPAYDSGDGLHSNDAGYQAMANAIDLNLLENGS
jgi:lysophospholipase L1-like esterase